MATPASHRTSSRTTRKIEAPRPLKDSSLTESNAKSSYSPLALSSYTIDCVEKLIALMDMVVNSINQLSDVNACIDPSLLTSNIVQLCKHLKIYGPQLENSIYQGQLDRAFLAFREGMVCGLLEYEARHHLLDIVELRICNWIPRKDLSPINIGAIPQSPSYQDFSEYSDFSSYQSNDSVLGFGSEDVKRPGKPREKLSKSASKSYLRNEVIIRNSDSGKVPPTAKERVVQITGPGEENISYAARLIENTIRNNASPVKEFCESESSYSSEDSSYGTSGYDEFGNYCSSNQKSKFVSQPYLYKHEVIVRNCHLTITGDDYTYVTVAKAILDDYFSKLRNSESPENINYRDDVFSDEKLLKEKNHSRKSVSHRMNDVSGSGDSKSYAGDLADASFTISSTDDPGTYSYIDYDLLNPTCEIRTDSMLSSDVSSLSLTQNCGVAPNDSSFPSEAVKSSAEIKASRNSYSKEFLLQLKDVESSQQKPKDWEHITLKFPQLLKGDSKEPPALKRTERRQIFCIYCATDVHNFARHLERKHSQETEVMKFIWRAKNDPERKKQIELLRKKGNFILNSSECIRPVRKLALPHGADDFTVCTYCMGHFSKRNFYKHAKICSFNTSGDKTQKNRFHHQLKARHFLAEQLKSNESTLQNETESILENETVKDFFGG